MLKRCRVHQSNLKTMNGFTFDDDVMADPTWDYVRFMYETRIPYSIPWGFSKNQTDICSKPISVDYCPLCEAEFQEGFADFKQLTEAQKEALFMESVRREAENNKQNKQQMATPRKPSD